MSLSIRASTQKTKKIEIRCGRTSHRQLTTLHPKDLLQFWPSVNWPGFRSRQPFKITVLVLLHFPPISFLLLLLHLFSYYFFFFLRFEILTCVCCLDGTRLMLMGWNKTGIAFKSYWPRGSSNGIGRKEGQELLLLLLNHYLMADLLHCTAPSYSLSLKNVLSFNRTSLLQGHQQTHFLYLFTF